MMQSNTPMLRRVPHDVIAVAAYYQWLKAGQPCGRDHEFWLKAEAQLCKTMALEGSAKVQSPATKRASVSPAPAGNGRVAGPRRVNDHKSRQRAAMSA